MLLLLLQHMMMLAVPFRLLHSLGRGPGDADGGEGETSTSSSASSAVQRRSTHPATEATAKEEEQETDAERLELLQRIKQLSHASAAKERLLQVTCPVSHLCLLALHRSSVSSSSSSSSVSPVALQDRIKSLEQQVASQRTYYQARLRPLSGGGTTNKILSSNKNRSSSSSSSNSAAGSQVGAARSDAPLHAAGRLLLGQAHTPGTSGEAETGSSSSSSSSNFNNNNIKLVAGGAAYPLFPLLHYENCALGTLFAFWQLCELTFAQSLLQQHKQQQQQQQQQLVLLQQEQHQEQQLKALVSLAFPSAFEGGRMIGFKDFQAALQRVGCPARHCDSINAWLLLSGVQQQQQQQQDKLLLEQQREAAAASAFIDGATLLRRAKVLAVRTPELRTDAAPLAAASSSSKQQQQQQQEQQQHQQQHKVVVRCMCCFRSKPTPPFCSSTMQLFSRGCSSSRTRRNA